MLRKNRRKKRFELPNGEVNVISLMDILTTMLFFLLVLASFANLSVVKSKSLVQGEPDEKPKPTFTLEIKVLDDKKAELFLGPIDKIDVYNRKNLESYLRKRFKGNPKVGYTRTLASANPERLRNWIQKILMKIKVGFPFENKVVISFSDNIDYQNMIHTISMARSIADGEDSIEVLSQNGRMENSRVLFPQVIVAEVQGGS
jgi:biopolymer transport protein ExbD